MSLRARVWVLVLLAAVIHGCACDDPDPLKDQYRDDPFGDDPFFADGRAMRPLPEHVVPREFSRAKDARNTGVAEGEYVETIPVPLSRAMLERGRHHFDIYCATCHGLRGDGNSFVARNMKLRPPPSLIVHHEHEGPAARALRAREPLPMPDERTAGLSSAPPSPDTPTGQAGLSAPAVVPDRETREAIARAAAGEVGVSEVSGEPGAADGSGASGMAGPSGAPGVSGIAGAIEGTADAGTRHPHFRPGFVFSVITEGYGLMPSYAPELNVNDRWAVIAYLEALRLSQRARVSTLPPELAARVRAEASR